MPALPVTPPTALPRTLREIIGKCFTTGKQPVGITTYHYPDLDGVASVLGLEALLRNHPALTQKNLPSPEALFFKDIHPEACWAVERCGLTLPRPPENSLDRTYVILDASRRADLDAQVQKVAFVLDHRDHGAPSDFPGITVLTEHVGALATTIAELFEQSSTLLPAGYAHLLYLGIMSNTLGFTTTNTTERDREQAQRLDALLQAHGIIGADSYADIFAFKSTELLKNLAESLDRETSSANQQFYGINKDDIVETAVCQLEIKSPNELIAARLPEIQKELEDIRNKRHAEEVMLVLPWSEAQQTYVVIPPTSKLHELFREQQVNMAQLSPWLYVMDGVIPRKHLIEKLARINVPTYLYDAYKQGGTFWPQIRGGIHIHLLHAVYKHGYFDQNQIEAMTLSDLQRDELKRNMDNLHRMFAITKPGDTAPFIHVAPERLDREWERSKTILLDALNIIPSGTPAQAIIEDAYNYLQAIQEPVARAFRLLFKPAHLISEDDHMVIQQAYDQLNIEADLIPSDPQDTRSMIAEYVALRLRTELKAKHPNHNTDWALLHFC
jgi:nanoRNase/pAp phosphatase (c-di-AMP/oligoRNAs hydrolase)